MNTLIRRLIHDSRFEGNRYMGANPREGYCCAFIKLTQSRLDHRWNQRVFCSRRVRADGAFCGQHDHLNVIVGEDIYKWLGKHGTNLDDAIMRSFSPRVRFLDLRGTPFEEDE